MCGFVGFLNTGEFNRPEIVQSLLKRMADTIVSRGPDDAGYWHDEAGVGLGHRRLSIVDLSPAGHQPMSSNSGRYVIAFNGEIYNHLRLREELQRSDQIAEAWRGHSDTETLLACFDVWGIEATLKKSIGMFAIALWDRVERTLVLIRDRLGEKPLYYGWQGHGKQATFLFGSDLKALKMHPAFEGDVNRDALALYMRHNCIGGEHSIYKGIRKLRPGHMLTVSAKNQTPVIKAWWVGSEVAEHGVAIPFSGSPDLAVDALDELLRDAVRQQMVADVPLGAFLSGGIDSSAVVALMQAQSSRPVKTFSIGFHEKGYNEAEHAKAVARHLGTDHTEMYVTPEQAMAVIPSLPSLYSEPFADSSQIPTFLVSQLARQHVTVSLSGDAGDELFSGYSRYQMTAKMWGKLSRLPLPLRRLMGEVVTSISPAAWDKLSGIIRLPRLGDRLHKGAGLLECQNVEALYRGMVSQWPSPNDVVLGAQESSSVLAGAEPRLSGLNSVERMMALDMLSYLPDDILVKVDRAAMGVSLETRVPFLDHRVVEFAWSLPLDYKLRLGSNGYATKWALRQVLYRYVPKTLIERPKMGFGIPIDSWLRGPLRDWAEALLNESRLKREGYFKVEPIQRKWREHLSGQRNWQYPLWCVLMFQAWLDEQN